MPRLRPRAAGRSPQTHPRRQAQEPPRRRRQHSDRQELPAAAVPPHCWWRRLAPTGASPAGAPSPLPPPPRARPAAQRAPESPSRPPLADTARTPPRATGWRASPASCARTTHVPTPCGGRPRRPALTRSRAPAGAAAQRARASGARPLAPRSGGGGGRRRASGRRRRAPKRPTARGRGQLRP
ncbi:hypothetical protein BU14_0288s0004 [Porphyra umbilicalis]|uniref:Uncharacterized protein n=1 Tax=Porphyra umbilicalis TaxID=2786 RepID=A0A1X6P119_PORUM|nr:hypothetical protein BU14_0288s0004 [Porphyra umbilicalis]|eukprot:OSX74450.1 hypothetical protein BU14_0288s0004 [Porphyra umbilicalis]